MGIFMLVNAAFIFLMIASTWSIFLKAGQPGWASILPIYNVIIFLKIIGKPWWWLILMLIPIINIVIIITVYHNLSLSFGKDGGYTIGLIFLGFIFFPILAFGDSKYIGPSNQSFIDNLGFGMILGVIAPMLGFLTFKWVKFGIFSFKEFFQFIYLEPGHKTLSVAMSLSLLANALLFTLYINAHKDQTAKGIFITTCIYGFMILLIKTFG